MALRLEPLMRYTANLSEPAAVGDSPFGNRVIFTVTDGEFEGDRLRGTLRAGGGDWLLVGPDGFGRLDVRATFDTDDGAAIYGQYFGILEVSERTWEAAGGGRPTEFGELRFLSQPRFETGDPRYAWLNAVVAVGEGRVMASAVEYQVYEVRQD